MRCPDCNKFVSMELGEPEVDSIEVEDADYDESGKGTGKVVCSVRVFRACADCGTELKEATLELEGEFELPPKDEAKAETEGEEAEHAFEVEETSIDQIEEGGGRWKKSYFGAEVFYTVTCGCGCEFSHEGSFSDKVAASEMEELV